MAKVHPKVGPAWADAMSPGKLVQPGQPSVMTILSDLIAGSGPLPSSQSAPAKLDSSPKMCIHPVLYCYAKPPPLDPPFSGEVSRPPLDQEGLRRCVLPCTPCLCLGLCACAKYPSLGGISASFAWQAQDIGHFFIRAADAILCSRLFSGGRSIW